MIRIKAYDRDSDFSTIVALFERRELPYSFAEEIPAFGFLAFDEQFENPDAVACGFLRMIENISIALMDSFCSDPAFSKALRHEALNLIAASLIRNAKILGKKKLILFTDDFHTLERAESFGFSDQGLKLYSLDLGGL